MWGYTLEFEIEQVESKLNSAMNEHFEKLHLQRMSTEEKILRESKTLINKLNHILLYLKALKGLRE